VAQVRGALDAAGLDVVIYDEVKVEPTDRSFLAAAKFAAEGKFDGYVSVGGGSVIDTCKAANLYATYPADFLDYVNAPIGAGKPVARPAQAAYRLPHHLRHRLGVHRHHHLRLARPAGENRYCVQALETVAGADRPCRHFTRCLRTSSRPAALTCCRTRSSPIPPSPTRGARRPAKPSLRPMSQGANPWSDIGCEAALKRLGRYLERAVNDASDTEARDQMMYAATLAGIAFGKLGRARPSRDGLLGCRTGARLPARGLPAGRNRWCRTA